VLAEAPLSWLLLAVPIAAWMHHARPDSPLLVFVLACVAIVPSVFAATGSGEMASRSVAFSVVVSAVLLVVYTLSLLFLLRTHADLFRGEEQVGEGDPHGTAWPVSLTVGVMAVVTLLIVWMSEILVGTVEHASAALGLSQLFVGVVVVAVVGNAAEHSTAVLVASRNRMEMAIGIAIGSSTQIALFVAPLLVLLSLVVAPEPLSLAFSGVEVFLVLAATFVASILLLDGKSTWFTGVQLIAVYLVMAITVFAIPA
jgi:Ca2+:H+ antiporter